MTASKSLLEFLLLAGLVVLVAGWVNWRWARKLGYVVLDTLLRPTSKWRDKLRPGLFVHVVLLGGALIWIWTRYREDRHAIVVLLEVAGITALASEVWAAQEMEEIKRGLQQAKVAPGAKWDKTEEHTAKFRRGRLRIGAALLISAALLGMFKAHEEVPPPPPPIEDEIKVVLQLPPADKLPPFLPGMADLTADIENAICLYRGTPADWESAVAIVVGRHDKTELSARARAQFTSNASLAEQRALKVTEALKDPLRCGPERAIAAKVSILQLDSPPRHAGHQASEQERAEDRSVEIYLLTATSRRIPGGVATGR